MATKIDQQKIAQLSERAAEQEARVKELREQAEAARRVAQEADIAARESEREVERLNSLMRRLLNGEDVNIDHSESLDEVVVGEHKKESVRFVQFPARRAISVAFGETQSPSSKNAELEVGTIIRSSAQNVEDDSNEDNYVSLACGNDFSRPDLPVTIQEVARMHQLRYLDLFEGPFPTVQQVERFQVAKLRHRDTGVFINRYACAVCGGDSVHDHRGCCVMGGLVVCNTHGHEVICLLQNAGARAVRKIGHEFKRVDVWAQYLGAVFGHVRDRVRDGADERSMLADNISFERQAFSEFRPHGVSRDIPLVVESYDEDEDEDEPISSSRFVKETFELTVQPLTQKELDDAQTEWDFRRLRKPFFNIQNQIEEMDPQGFRENPVYKEAYRAVGRINHAWMMKDPEGYELCKRKLALSRLITQHDRHVYEQQLLPEAERVPFADIKQMIELMREDGLVALAQGEMESNARRATRGESSPSRKIQDAVIGCLRQRKADGEELTDDEQKRLDEVDRVKK